MRRWLNKPVYSLHVLPACNACLAVCVSRSAGSQRSCKKKKLLFCNKLYRPGPCLHFGSIFNHRIRTKKARLRGAERETVSRFLRVAAFFGVFQRTRRRYLWLPRHDGTDLYSYLCLNIHSGASLCLCLSRAARLCSDAPCRLCQVFFAICFLILSG